MAIPVLKLNLAPPPSLWRQHHELLGVLAAFAGILGLLLASTISVQKYLQATREGRRLVSISEDAQRVGREQGRLLESLRQIDPVERAPRYKLAERIFLERTLPWSRLTAELERSLVQDVRVKSLQRVRGNDGAVALKVRGEARTRETEVKFIESLQGNRMFAQVVLEREAERQGGGIDFDLTLPVAPLPPPFQPLPMPPPTKVDQFGKPLAKDSKILRQISGPGMPTVAPAASGKAPVPSRPTAAPAAAPAAAPVAVPVPAPPSAPMPAPVAAPARAPGSGDGDDADSPRRSPRRAPRPEQPNAPEAPATPRPRPPRPSTLPSNPGGAP